MSRKGTLKEGKGVMKPAHGGEVAFSMPTRFAGAEGSNPEEMIGAALAGCFSMALSAQLGKANLTPQSIQTSADVHLEKEDAGFRVTRIDLITVADVPDAEEAQFQAIAAETKRTCPISKALGAVTITLAASLQ